MERIKEITVNKQVFDVAFMPIQKTNYSNGWVCAYVKIKGSKKIKAIEHLDYCTYQENDVLGIDTNHCWNFDMTYQEREKDAIMQIRSLIKDALKALQ